ncbi:hypothetical protein C8F01DRAFT_1084001 [Mycena amicta]|nr:hypothetical protein C8F01DRAFT_1084001 [Mycena amicta]
MEPPPRTNRADLHSPSKTGDETTASLSIPARIKRECLQPCQDAVGHSILFGGGEADQRIRPWVRVLASPSILLEDDQTPARRSACVLAGPQELGNHSIGLKGRIGVVVRNEVRAIDQNAIDETDLIEVLDEAVEAVGANVGARVEVVVEDVLVDRTRSLAHLARGEFDLCLAALVLCEGDMRRSGTLLKSTDLGWRRWRRGRHGHLAFVKVEVGGLGHATKCRSRDILGQGPRARIKARRQLTPFVSLMYLGFTICQAGRSAHHDAPIHFANISYMRRLNSGEGRRGGPWGGRGRPQRNDHLADYDDGQQAQARGDQTVEVSIDGQRMTTTTTNIRPLKILRTKDLTEDDSRLAGWTPMAGADYSAVADIAQTISSYDEEPDPDIQRGGDKRT